MSERRLQQLEDNLSRILDALKTHYAPEHVIVFGSLASGHVTETSDLDLLIVKNTDKRFFDRIREACSFSAPVRGRVRSCTRQRFAAWVEAGECEYRRYCLHGWSRVLRDLEFPARIVAFALP